LKYDVDTFKEKLVNKYKASIGTEIHAWAAIQIELGNKVTSKRELMKSLRTYIYSKYYTDKYGLSKFGRSLLNHLKQVPADTISSYVNDAIGFKMDPETVVYYSENFFGTADATRFSNDSIMIFDLKTGTSPVHIEQLMIYDALHCLEHGVNPMKVSHELRIYQGNDILLATPVGEDIKPIMDTIEYFDKIMTKFEGGNSYE
jgi:hypothetical protein